MQDLDSPQASVGEDAAATAGVLYREVWQSTAQSTATCSSELSSGPFLLPN